MGSNTSPPPVGFETNSPTGTPSTEPYYLGEKFSAIILVTALILAVVGIGLNIGIMKFHQKKRKRSIVSFIYFILGLSDFFTGLCALLHSLIFAILLVMHGKMNFGLYWLIIPAYFFTVIAFKVSAFVSMVFAIIRTINIVFPFRIIKKDAVYASITLYTIFWMLMFSIEIGFLLGNHIFKSGHYSSPSLFHDLVMGTYFYNPNRISWPETIFLSLEEKQWHPIANCTLEITYTVVPFTLCAIATIICTLIQLKYLSVSDCQYSDQSIYVMENKRQTTKKISHNIAIISTFFVICTSWSLYHPINDVCLNPSHLKSRQLFYVLGYIPFFVNAAGNPLILVMRVKTYREFLMSKMLYPLIRGMTNHKSSNHVALTVHQGAGVH